LFGEDAEIDVYEKGKVGGRLATVTIDGREYEAGGSIIHPKNQYMVNFTRILGIRNYLHFNMLFKLIKPLISGRGRINRKGSLKLKPTCMPDWLSKIKV